MISNISIPYGAIKSLAKLIFENLVMEFQFLMVRLKAFYFDDNSTHIDISIPYGAIKSIGGCIK